jgi:hypothetical protein
MTVLLPVDRLKVNGFRFQAGRKKDLLPEKANRKENKMEKASSSRETILGQPVEAYRSYLFLKVLVATRTDAAI